MIYCIDSFARITHFDNDDDISIENYGFSNDLNIVKDQFNVRQDTDNNKTYLSIDTPLAKIDNMFEIDGVFYLDDFYTEIETVEGHEDINLRIKLMDAHTPTENTTTFTASDRQMAAWRSNIIYLA